ncbi:MAG TPA: hypothetical protein VH089_17585 [Streptosporangiaceae bacterium]|nr:hypothetical protein [Streptosporangiaceae bacterium]
MQVGRVPEHRQRRPQRGPLAAARALLALRTGYVFSTGLEEDAGWAGQFLAAHDRIVAGG